MDVTVHPLPLLPRHTGSVPADNAFSWDRLSDWYQANARIPTDVVTYGGGLPTEAELRLCGDVKGKRVLELGCGGAQCAIAFAKQGARSIGVDISAVQLAYGRRLAEAEGVRVELRHCDMADLGFITSGSIDLAFSAQAFAFVDDLNRVFRQVHRVLRPEAPLVFSLRHPFSTIVHADRVIRAYWSDEPNDWEEQGIGFTTYQHTVADLFAALARAGFRVDAILEPEPPNARRAMIPPGLVMRARKQGV